MFLRETARQALSLTEKHPQNASWQMAKSPNGRLPGAGNGGKWWKTGMVTTGHHWSPRPLRWLGLLEWNPPARPWSPRHPWQRPVRWKMTVENVMDPGVWALNLSKIFKTLPKLSISSKMERFSNVFKCFQALTCCKPPIYPICHAALPLCTLSRIDGELPSHANCLNDVDGPRCTKSWRHAGHAVVPLTKRIFLEFVKGTHMQTSREIRSVMLSTSWLL